MTVENRKILEDGWRNAVVQVTGVLDTADITLDSFIQLSDLTNNDLRAGSLVGLRVDCIEYSIGDGLQFTLYWQSTANELIASLAGRGKLKYYRAGGLQPNQSAIGYSGNILYSSTGFNTQGVPPQNFSILVSFVKLYR